MYDYPKRSELPGGDVAPDVDQVAYAIARNTGARIQPSEAVAASLLGLTDQVPARIVYLQLLPAITGSPQLNHPKADLDAVVAITPRTQHFGTLDKPIHDFGSLGRLREERPPPPPPA